MKSRIGTLLALAVLLFTAIPSAEARITRVVFTRVESPTFGGASFGAAGEFEKLVGTAYGEVDPSHPLNAIIQDIDLAPRNAQGMVEYSTDIYIIKPVDMTKGNRALVYELGNRGNKLLWSFVQLNLGVIGGNEPTTAGDGFLQRMGYTVVWSGWQPDVLAGDGRMTMRVPIARNPDGSSIVGIVRAEFPITSTSITTTLPLSFGNSSGRTHASYATVSGDNQRPLPDGFLPTLTVRGREQDPRVPISNTQWAFGSCPDGVNLTPSDTEICLFSGFQFGKIYELIYRAKDPTVIGLGYAGTRDLVSFLKHERHDDYGTLNPLWIENDAKHEKKRGHHGKEPLKAVTTGSSQSGRNIRQYIHLGFNEDEAGRIVFEGALPHIGGGRAAFNIRFGQPGRAWGHQVDHDYPAYEFPFSYMPTHDPLTGKTNGVLKRCRKTNTCPKIFHAATPSEIWEGRDSLGRTDPLGRHDLGEAGFVRNYIMASTQHGPAPFPPLFGNCQQQSNPNPQRETMRALWVAFTQWINEGIKPPPSQAPTLRDGTLVLPSKVDFPLIPANNYGGVSRPAVKYLALVNPLWVLNFGPLFNNEDESGIITVEPPEVLESLQYTILVPQVDADGNDLAGIRTTAIQAPIATYAGWNPFRPGLFGEQLCTRQGSYIPFARTRAERLAIGDPRLSLEERYGTHEGYVAAVRAAAARLVAQRFLLPEDAARLISEAEASDVLR
jgi:hypothetical protein